MKPFLLIGLVVIAYSCGSTNYNGILPELTVNGKNYNRLIENRIPDYGIDGEDGCVRQEELSLDLFLLASDSIKGIVRDARLRDPMPFSEVLFYNNENLVLSTLADSTGVFITEVPKGANRMEVKFIIYRTLKLKLPKF